MNQQTMLNYEFSRQFHAHLLANASKQVLAKAARAAPAGKDSPPRAAVGQIRSWLQDARGPLHKIAFKGQRPRSTYVAIEQAGACCGIL